MRRTRLQQDGEISSGSVRESAFSLGMSPAVFAISGIYPRRTSAFSDYISGMTASKTKKRMTEANTLGTAPLDAEMGLIRGAKLVGRESVNGRIYMADALRHAIPHYEGARVNLDHPSRGVREEDRKFTEWVGVVENVTEGSDGLYGDINLRKKSGSYEEIIEAAEHFPQHFGLSHVAECGYDVVDGVEHIHEIAVVESVDIVLEPATTNGLYESKGRKTMTTKKRTLLNIVESAPHKYHGTKVLREMIEGDAPVMEPDTVIDVEAAATPEDAVRQGLLQAIALKLETADAAALQGVLASLDLPTDAAEIAAGEGGSESTEASESDEESTDTAQSDEAEEKTKALESKLARLEAKDMLYESGVKPTPARIRALANTATGDQKSLIESWPTESVSESNGRPSTSPPARSSGDTGTKYESAWENKVKSAREKSAR